MFYTLHVQETKSSDNTLITNLPFFISLFFEFKLTSIRLNPRILTLMSFFLNNPHWKTMQYIEI